MIKIRHLRLRVETDGPICGADIDFTDGLNIVRADNSSGKSTCLQAIIYALGLEGMLSPRRTIPLPHVMTDALDIDNRQHQVISSSVALEIENSTGDILTATRSVRSTDRDTTLITVQYGAALTGGTVSSTQDFFVRRPGAAQREAGFHFELAKFLGWQLPYVARMDGSEGPLYIECLFPYFFVEQKHGWSGVQARTPTYFRIRDVGRRSAEFTLALDAYNRVLQRQRLETAGTIIEQDWRERIELIRAQARIASVTLQRLPGRPSTSLEDENLVSVLIPRGDRWTSLDDAIGELRVTISHVQHDVPTVADSAGELGQRLAAAQSELTATSSLLSDASSEFAAAKKRRVDLQDQISSVEVDLQRHKDNLVLKQLGARNVTVLETQICPTCQQNIPDGFDITYSPMSEDENINFIEEELKTFRSMDRDLERNVDIQQTRVDRIQAAARTLRYEIRTIKDSLVSPSQMPSAAILEQRLRNQERLGVLEQLRDEINQSNTELAQLLESWKSNRAARRQLDTGSVTEDDSRKLSHMRKSLVDQLKAYGFRSLEPESIDISQDTYRPTHEGFDLGFDLSASDMVRVIWSYLLAMLETSLAYETNHIRLLILDEPRQQETSRMSFAALLRRSAQAAAQGAQIIFATSEEEDQLRRMLKEVPSNLISLPPGNKLIGPVDTSDT